MVTEQIYAETSQVQMSHCREVSTFFVYLCLKGT